MTEVCKYKVGFLYKIKGDSRIPLVEYAALSRGYALITKFTAGSPYPYEGYICFDTGVNIDKSSYLYSSIKDFSPPTETMISARWDKDGRHDLNSAVCLMDDTDTGGRRFEKGSNVFTPRSVPTVKYGGFLRKFLFFTGIAVCAIPIIEVLVVIICTFVFGVKGTNAVANVFNSVFFLWFMLMLIATLFLALGSHDYFDYVKYVFDAKTIFTGKHTRFTFDNPYGWVTRNGNEVEIVGLEGSLEGVLVFGYILEKVGGLNGDKASSSVVEKLASWNLYGELQSFDGKPCSYYDYAVYDGRLFNKKQGQFTTGTGATKQFAIDCGMDDGIIAIEYCGCNDLNAGTVIKKLNPVFSFLRSKI